MPVKFSELLDAKRVRPFWGKGRLPSEGEDEGAREKLTKSELDEQSDSQKGTAARSSLDDELDPNSAPTEPPDKLTPLQILDKLEDALRIAIGPRAMMLGIHFYPLRRLLGRLEGQPQPMHPLQSALRTGNLPLFLYQLEDSIRGLMRTTQRYGL